MKTLLITGANAGIGKETARQMALIDGVEKIYMGCRNISKAQKAKHELEQSTGKMIFEILLIDVSNLDSVRSAVHNLPEPIEALVMNAGGTGGKKFSRLTKDAVTKIFAVNVLGHVVLTDELIKANKLTKFALYAGSEAARGVKEMGMKRPNLKTSSVEEFRTIGNGNYFGEVKDATIPYGPIKYMAALWMSSIAREHTNIRFVTMSPGGTAGTDALNNLSPIKRFMMKGMMKVMLALGKVHKLEVGAQRFVDAILNESFKSGIFYASKSGISGAICDQGELFPDLKNKAFQDNASHAIHSFIS